MDGDAEFTLTGRPGEFIEINQPAYVNVRLESRKLVPLKRDQAKLKTPGDDRGLAIYSHAYILDFVITYHACQVRSHLKNEKMH